MITLCFHARELSPLINILWVNIGTYVTNTQSEWLDSNQRRKYVFLQIVEQAFACRLEIDEQEGVTSEISNDLFCSMSRKIFYNIYIPNKNK